MSLQFLMSEGQALAIDGHLQRMLLSQLWGAVGWGRLDYLLVDLPPGTGEILQAVVDVMPVAGALVVVTPQDVAHLDACKLLTFLDQRGVRILGGVENMRDVTCPHCDDSFQLFPPVSRDRAIWAGGLPKIASLPFDPSAFNPMGNRGDRSEFDSQLSTVTASLTDALPPSSSST